MDCCVHLRDYLVHIWYLQCNEHELQYNSYVLVSIRCCYQGHQEILRFQLGSRDIQRWTFWSRDFLGRNLSASDLLNDRVVRYSMVHFLDNYRQRSCFLFKGDKVPVPTDHLRNFHEILNSGVQPVPNTQSTVQNECYGLYPLSLCCVVDWIQRPLYFMNGHIILVN